MADELNVEVDSKNLIKQLENFNKQVPNVAQRLMKSVNAEVKRKIKQEAKSRGYKGKKSQSWGDSGYTHNLKSYQNKDFSAKIMMAKPAFYYRFIEYGANVRPKNGKFLAFKIGKKWVRSKGFTYPAKPLIYPIANSIWGTNKASQIMEQQLQKELDKLFKDKQQ